MLKDGELPVTTVLLPMGNMMAVHLSNVQNPVDIPLSWLLNEGILTMAAMAYYNPHITG